MCIRNETHAPFPNQFFVLNSNSISFYCLHVTIFSFLFNIFRKIISRCKWMQTFFLTKSDTLFECMFNTKKTLHQDKYESFIIEIEVIFIFFTKEKVQKKFIVCTLAIRKIHSREIIPFCNDRNSKIYSYLSQIKTLYSNFV